MEMGQDTYRHSASAGFPLGVTMVTYPISLPTYLPACLPAFNAQTTHPRSRATGFAPERTDAAPVRKKKKKTSDTSYPVSHSRAWKCKVVCLMYCGKKNNHTHLLFL